MMGGLGGAGGAGGMDLSAMMAAMGQGGANGEAPDFSNMDFSQFGDQAADAGADSDDNADTEQ
jgi:hypothetical protein